MTDLYIFRHGNTEKTERSFRGGGPKDLPILEMGIPALKRIGLYLKEIQIDASFTSPYQRCVQSSGVVESVTGKKYKTDERLSEFSVSKERFSTFHKKVTEFLDEIDNKNYSAISICTHGAVISAIKHLKINGKFSFLQALDFPNPGNLMIIKNNKVEVLNFNL